MSGSLSSFFYMRERERNSIGGGEARFFVCCRRGISPAFMHKIIINIQWQMEIHTHNWFATPIISKLLHVTLCSKVKGSCY